MKMLGFSQKDIVKGSQGMGKKMLIFFIGSLITAYVLMMLINLTSIGAVNVAFHGFK